jgi:hypothetical protein
MAMSSLSGLATAAPPAAFPISTQGRLVALPSALLASLHSHHLSLHIYILAVRDGTTFLRRGDGGRCFGTVQDFDLQKIAEAKRPWLAFGMYVCRGNPSALIDLSVFGGSRGEPVHLLRLKGIAADSVRRVELIGNHGRVIRSVRVIGNVYAASQLPRDVLGIRAVDSRGAVLEQVP